MKSVYFVQHGIAHAKEVDPSRALSDQGSLEVHKVARYLKAHNITVDKICHSGKLRARQTAVIFSQLLAVKELVEFAGMAPGDDPELLTQQISENAVMYIGHLPNLSRVVAQLVTGDGNRSIIKFQNAAVLCIEMDESSAAIKWFLTADMC